MSCVPGFQRLSLPSCFQLCCKRASVPRGGGCEGRGVVDGGGHEGPGGEPGSFKMGVVLRRGAAARVLSDRARWTLFQKRDGTWNLSSRQTECSPWSGLPAFHGCCWTWLFGRKGIVQCCFQRLGRICLGPALRWGPSLQWAWPADWRWGGVQQGRHERHVMHEPEPPPTLLQHIWSGCSGTSATAEFPGSWVGTLIAVGLW